MENEDKNATTETAPTIEELKAQVEELKKSLTEKDSKVKEYQDAQSEDQRKAYEKREQAKKEALKALEEGQEFKKAYETLKQEYDSLAPVKSEYEKLQRKIKNDLLGQLDEADRETFSDLPIEKIEAIVNKLKSVTATEQKPDAVNVDTSKTHGSKVLQTKKWSEMTDNEKNELAATNPKKVSELIKAEADLKRKIKQERRG